MKSLLSALLLLATSFGLASVYAAPALYQVDCDSLKPDQCYILFHYGEENQGGTFNIYKYPYGSGAAVAGVPANAGNEFCVPLPCGQQYAVTATPDGSAPKDCKKGVCQFSAVPFGVVNQIDLTVPGSSRNVMYPGDFPNAQSSLK